MPSYISLMGIYIDQQKLNEIGNYVSGIINRYFSNIVGGVLLAIIIIVVVFSLLGSSKR